MDIIQVWSQCPRCQASMTVLMYVQNGAILSIEPDRHIIEKNNVLYHHCGGELQFFTTNGGLGSNEFCFKKPEKYHRERRKKKELRIAVVF